MVLSETGTNSENSIKESEKKNVWCNSELYKVHRENFMPEIEN